MDMMSYRLEDGKSKPLFRNFGKMFNLCEGFNKIKINFYLVEVGLEKTNV